MVFQRALDSMFASVAMGLLLAACAARPQAEPEAPAVVVNVSDSAEQESPESAPPPELSTSEQVQEKQTATDKKIEELVAALDKLDDTVVMGRLGSGDVAGVLGSSDVPPGLLDAAAAQAQVRRSSSAGGGGKGRAPGLAERPAASGIVGGGTNPARGKVVLGPTTVIGGAVSNAESQVARLQPKFRRCYQAALAHDPTEKGSLVLEIDVGSKGEATQSRGAVRKGVSHGLQQCIEAVALSGRFSQPAGGSSTLALQITFELTR